MLDSSSISSPSATVIIPVADAIVKADVPSESESSFPEVIDHVRPVWSPVVARATTFPYEPVAPASARLVSASVTVGAVVTLGGWSSPAAASDIVLEARQWSLDNFGQDLIAAHDDGRIYRWFKNNGPEVHAVEVSTTTTAGVSTGIPLNNDFILVSPRDRHVISLGCTDTVTGAKDPMVLRYSDQANIEEWTPSVSTTSDQIRLGNGNRIIGAVPSRNNILVWTDTALYGMQFVGPPYTFALNELGTKCGLVAPHAATDYHGNAYWMGEDNFYVFDGAVRVLPSTVRLYVFDDLNRDNITKIYCGVNQEFKEVVWLYPTADSTECNRYVIYSPEENYWTFGTHEWTTWADKGIFNSILTTGVSSTGDAHLFDNEPLGVYTDDGGSPVASYLESAEFDIEDGDDVLFVDRIIPDFDFNTSAGPNSQISLRLITKRFRKIQRHKRRVHTLSVLPLTKLIQEHEAVKHEFA